MNHISFSALLAAAALFHAVLVPFAGAQTTNYFYTGTTINTAIYDGQSIVVDGCTVAVVGRHEFANVNIVTNGAMTCSNLVVDGALTVAEGTTLTISGGSLLQVDGALTVETNASLICQGLNTSGQVVGQWAGVGVSIQAGSVTVPLGGSISADGQGYIAAQGPGAGGNSDWGGGGGGYGGNGGFGNGTGSGGGTYGSVLLSAELGSGGGNDNYASGGNGGGAIELSVAQSLTLDGTISANGLTGQPSKEAGGGGSGGSILIMANNLAGGGSIQADGGGAIAGGGAGGGGRVAVYYTNATSLTVFSNSAANGASPGTAVFVDASVPSLGINSLSGNLRFGPGTTNHFSYVTVNGATSMTLGGGSVLVVDGALTVESNASLICQGLNTSGQVSGQWAGVGVSIQAGSVTVPLGGSISADGQGYIAAQGPGAGGNSDWGGGGGGYGGNGGFGNGTGSGGGTYGSVLLSAELGSGGGNDNYASGGNGGGAIELSVAQSLTLDGTISADGLTSQPSKEAGGGGSGGSILIMANNLAGGGSIHADGATGIAEGGTGGGGRVAVYYTNATSLTVFSNSAANGASPGTAVFVDASVPSLGINSLMGNLLFSPATTNHFSYVTVNGATSMTLGGGSVLAVDGALTVESNASLICQGLNTSGQVSGQWAGVGVSIQAGSVTVPLGGSISADGQGYIAAQGPGAGGNSDWGGGGGGYGGNGGFGNGTGSGGGTYGSVLLSAELGSGGGNDNYASGGNGGGAIELSVAQSLTLDGTISADGLTSQPSKEAGGGGSGGSILIMANNLAGGGSIHADGATGIAEGGTGGGGRVAVYYTNATSLTVFSNSAANGASPGTAVFVDASVPSLGINSLMGNLLFSPATTNHFSYVTVNGATSMTLGGGSVLVVDGALTVESNASLICQGLNTSGQVSGQWAGVGVSIQAGSVTVPLGGSISADGQGYIAAQGPGAGGNSDWGGGGGGYGGNGGFGKGTGSGGGTYGSVLLSAELGSGGGNDNYASGGNGGGAIELSVAQSLTLDGTISADGLTGQPSRNAGGGGSGGSILIMANNLAGGGSIQADGGAGIAGGGAGGGGRVTIFLAQALTYQTNSVTANGGDGAQPGSVLEIIKHPVLKMLPQDDGGACLNWAAFPVYSYQVQYCTNLNLCNWSDVGGVLSPTNYTWLTVSNAVVGDTQGYYRVKVLP